MLTENLSCSKSPGRINYCNFPVPEWWTGGTMMASCHQGRDSAPHWGVHRGQTQVKDEVSVEALVCIQMPCVSHVECTAVGRYENRLLWSYFHPKSGRKSILIPTLELQKAFADRLRNPDWFQCVTWVLWKELEMRHVRNCQYYIKIYYIHLQTIYYFWQTYNAFTDTCF